MGREACAGDDVIAVLVQAPHGQVTLNATLGIQQLRVDEATHGPGDVVGADPAQGALGIAAEQLKFCERTLIEHGDAFPCRLMFARYSRKPVRAREAVFIAR